MEVADQTSKKMTVQSYRGLRITFKQWISFIGNDGNSFLKTNDYARGDIGLSSGLPNSPPHFCFSKGEGRSK
jgi:hypothetical protein